MLAPLRGGRADYSLMLEKYGSMNFFPCQAKSEQIGAKGVCQVILWAWAGSLAQSLTRPAWVHTPKNSSAAAAMATSPTTGRGDPFPRPVMARPPVSSAQAEVLLSLYIVSRKPFVTGKIIFYKGILGQKKLFAH